MKGLIAAGFKPGDILTQDIQHGEIEWTGSLTATDTLSSSVDIARSLVIYQGCFTGSDVNDIGEAFARVDLTNASTVTATSWRAPLGTNTLKYMVIELNALVFKSIQTGTVAATLSGGTDTITSVVIGKTFVFYQGSEVTAVDATDLRRGLGSMTLTNATTVTGNVRVGSATVGYTALELV